MKTLQLRIKDKHAKVLDLLARETNTVWNYCNELSYKHTQRTGKFLSGYDLQKYTKGVGKEGFSLNSASVQMIGSELVARRKQFKRVKLNWRTSFGKRKSLGWIPFRHDCITYRNGQLHHAGFHFNLWDSYDLSKYELGSGSFSQDSRGRWYANITIEQKLEKSQGTASIGIDLGLKDFATFSNGEKVVAEQFYRKEQSQLAIAQRANKKQRIKAIHAKIANRRKDHLHKLSTRLVKENAAIFVGNVNASALAKTKMAKSVLDAGWSGFRTMLSYKSIGAGVLFEEIDEKYTTQDCSYCGCISHNSPKGMNSLGIREWTCAECGTTHDRDINAAKNILERGHALLAVGIPVL